MLTYTEWLELHGTGNTAADNQAYKTYQREYQRDHPGWSPTTVSAGEHGSRDWDPGSFLDEHGNPMSKDDLLAGFGLSDEYASYFEDSDLFYGELDIAIKEAENAWNSINAEKELLTSSFDLGTDIYESRTDRLGEKTLEAGMSLGQGLGSTYTAAANAMSDTVAQGVGQQTFFTSGVSGRQQESAFNRVSTSMLEQTERANIGFTETTRNIEQAQEELTFGQTGAEDQYNFDLGDAERKGAAINYELDKARLKAERDWTFSVYDSVMALDERDAWGLGDDD